MKKSKTVKVSGLGSKLDIRETIKSCLGPRQLGCGSRA